VTTTALTLLEQSAPRQLPPLLQRPDDRGAIAHLTLSISEETPDGRGGPRWSLKGSPAVIVMAEKLFSGARCSKARDAISWPAVASMFEDLLMLQHRYPVSIGRTASELWGEQYADLVASYEERLALAPIGAPKGGGRFKGTLRDFQKEGLSFMVAHRKTVLGDDMGLGKTIQALALLDRLDDWPALIVCQPHVMKHWERKIEEFLDARDASRPLTGASGAISWLSLRGIKAGRDTPKADLYLAHYLIMGAWENWLRARGVRTIIFDECQELRHPGTRKHDACRTLARTAKSAVGLSGTPIYNKGIEVYNVWNAINRGCLGTKVDFQRTWCSESDVYLVENPQALGQYLRDRGLLLRRTKAEVLSEMPEKQRVIEPIDADNAKFAELLKEAIKLAKNAALVRDPFDRGKMEAEALAKTRMATGVAKAPGVIAFLRALLEAEQPTLVFAHHHAVHDLIQDALEGFSPVRITGQETMGQKDTAVKRFAAGETNLCQIALRAATGIDGLQARARVVVFAEFDWSPAIHWQAEDRAHRMGQRESVIAYYLTTDLGTDPGMLEVLSIKEAQALGVMHDKVADEADHALAQAAAERHKADILAMLRGQR
jgi:SWI/SNF-related matrix-associated actin-dependent regulator 1 of chromatin subfamily A